MDINNVLDEFKNRGYRTTKARKFILELLSKTKTPLSAHDVLKSLSQNNLSVNKSTVYRELDFLLSQGIVKNVGISTACAYYELSSLPHHHHLICTDCGEILPVRSEVLENTIGELMKKVKKGGFKIEDHNLEFFGRCGECK